MIVLESIWNGCLMRRRRLFFAFALDLLLRSASDRRFTLMMVMAFMMMVDIFLLDLLRV